LLSPTPQAALRRLVVQVLPILAVLTMPLLVPSTQHARAQASEGSIRLSPAMSTVPAGDGTFTVYVVLEDLTHLGQISYDDNRDTVPDREVPSDGMAAFQFTIEYDPAIVEVQSVEQGPDLNRTGRSFQCLAPARDPGAVSLACLSLGSDPAGVQGTLTLASVQLTPRSNGLSPLVVSAEVAGPLGDSVQIDVGGGAARVTGAGTNATPTRAATAAPSTPAVPPSGGTRAPTAVPVTTTLQSATATALEDGTPHPTATLVGGQSTPPATPIGGPRPNGDGSGSSIWIWSLSIGGALGLTALGLTAVLWRRRAQGGL